MIPALTVKPVSENIIKVILATGITIEIRDSGPIGGTISISEKEEGLRLGRFKQIDLISKEADAAGCFRAEMKTGVGP